MKKKEEIVKLLNKNISIKEIMRQTGASRHYIWDLKAMHKPSEFKKRDVLLLLERGMAPRYIADKVKVSMGYVYNISSWANVGTQEKDFNWKLNNVLKVMPLNVPISSREVSERIGNNDYSRNVNYWYSPERLYRYLQALKYKKMVIMGGRINRKSNANCWTKITENGLSVSNET